VPKLDKTQALDRFLADVERRAFRMAQIATGSREDALDIVQDAMFKLVEKYAARDEDEWGPLFQKILQSRIRDWYRRNTVRNRFRVWFSKGDEDDSVDPMQTIADERGRNPEQLLQTDRSIDKLDEAIHGLSIRQQQAFLLRIWEGLDVKQTARAMSCSEGSVKTHYSRAVHTLREHLSDNWP